MPLNNDINSVRVCVIDEHPLIRDGVKNLLMNTPHITVVDCVKDGSEFFSKNYQNSCDIIITDINQRNINGYEILEMLRAERLPVNVIVYTYNKKEEAFQNAIKKGAKGYILKTENTRLLKGAIENVNKGRFGLSPALFPPLQIKKEKEPELAAIINSLTPREHEIFSYLALEMTSKEIAGELGVKKCTVDKHRENIRKKTKKVRNITMRKLIMYANEKNHI